MRKITPQPDYGVAEIRNLNMIFLTLPREILQNRWLFLKDLNRRFDLSRAIFVEIDVNTKPRTIVFHVRRWSLWRIYATCARGRLIGSQTNPRARVEPIWSLPITCTKGNARDHKESQSCNWIKWGRDGAQTEPAQWQIRRAIIFYIRLASFQLTPAYGRQRLRGYCRHGRVQFPTLLLF